MSLPLYDIIIRGLNNVKAQLFLPNGNAVSSNNPMPITPGYTAMDPVEKMRVSTPQSLIDTDFEYSTQATKWETLALTNTRPFAYYNAIAPITITSITTAIGSRFVTVTTGTSVTAGTPVYIQDSTFVGANGLFVANGTGTTFTYTAQFPATASGSILNAGVTVMYIGLRFTNAQVGGTPTFGWTSGTLIPVTTTVPHGLSVGNEITITGSSEVNANGSWLVARVQSNNIFHYYSITAPAANPTGGSVFTRAQGTGLHRPYDGGVKFSSNAQGNNEQLVRQTRKYFRYQSGKGIQFSTGTLLKPSLTTINATYSGTSVTVITRDAHNLQVGSFITMTGATNPIAVNGTYRVTNIVSAQQFVYTIPVSIPSGGTVEGTYNLSVSSWTGSSVKVGIYDDQNGVFFEYDGNNLYVVRRSSTYQVAGDITVTNGSNTVTGVNSAFSKQLSPGDFIVLKGASYRIQGISSDTSLILTSSYRGPSLLSPSFAVMTKTVDTKIPQSSWNLDKMDGKGISQYAIDITKMQMFYIDYSWYGAGYIRWGFRGTDGVVTYCHKLVNNNVNYEAYMRSGNLPARYETSTFPNMTTLTSTFSNVDTTINVASTANFPTPNLTGTVPYVPVLAVRTASGVIEYIGYRGKTATSFTGCIRAQTGATINLTIAIGSNVATTASTVGLQPGMRVISTAFPDGTYVYAIVDNTTLVLSNSAVTANPTGVIFSPLGTVTSATTFTYSATAPTTIEEAYPTFAPQISHWGSSVIMDGRFDNDKNFIFTSGTTTALSVPAIGNNFALMSIRLAPSVDNGIVGAFGIRELVNRMQLTLDSLGIYALGNYLITLIINGQVSAADNWVNVGGSSLAQVCFHGAGRTISGGEVVGGFYVNSPGATFGTSTYELTMIRELGNAIRGGGTTTVNTQYFPDGPDTLTIMVQALTATGGSAVFGRLSWTEAQA
jgi:hypothetical protein